MDTNLDFDITEDDLAFSIMLNTEAELSKLYNDIKETWKDIEKIERGLFIINGFYIELTKNDMYDKSLIDKSENKSIYYPYEVVVDMFDDNYNHTLDQVITFAKDLKNRFETMGCDASICAYFEKLL